MASTIRWEDEIFGKVRQEDWLDVGTQVPTRQNDPIDGLFGDEKTDNIVAHWESIATQYQIPVMAQFHGFDTEAQTTFRVPIDTHNIEKGLIKVKINQSERLHELTRSGVQGDQALYDWVLNDGIRLADQVVTRTKVAKNELMATGKVTIKENNLDLTVDYGVPQAQTAFTLDLNEDADISSQIQTIVDYALDIGVTLTGMLTSRKNISRMRKNRELQAAINGSLSIGALLTQGALESYLSSEFGIDNIITNDLTYGASAVIGADGRPTINQKRYFPDDVVTFFASNPGGKLGTGLWGDPPEVDAARFYQTNTSGVSPFVYVMQWMETDPSVLWTKASGLFIPVLYNPNSLFICKVTSVDSLPDVKVTPKKQNTTIYGVSVADIQKPDVAVLGNADVAGTLKYMGSSNAITDVWGFGNFLAVDFNADDWSDYTSVKVGLEPSAGSGPAELIGEDEKDGVFKIADPAVQKLVITAKNGVHTDKQVYDLSGLTLESAGA